MSLWFTYTLKKHGSPLGHVVIVKDNNPCPYTITSGVKSKDSTKNPKFCLCVVLTTT